MSKIKEEEICIHKLVLSLRVEIHTRRRLSHKKVFSLFSSPFEYFSYVLIIRIFYLQRFFDKTYKQNIMARNLENSTSENSNVQEMGLRRSVRLNATINGAAPPPRVSTMGTTTVATSVATRGEVHGAFTTARAVPSKAHGTKATAQAVPSKLARVRA